jgi:hypothetical protein
MALIALVGAAWSAEPAKRSLIHDEIVKHLDERMNGRTSTTKVPNGQPAPRAIRQWRVI